MNKKGMFARTAVGLVGGVILLGSAGAAVAATIEDDDVTVNVEIEALEPVGALTMSVAASSTSLSEGATETDGTRVFTGDLPTVTVSDDRAEVPEGVYWYVTGQSSDFVSGVNTISAGHLGWLPNLITPAEDGEVAAGDEVVTVLDEATQGGGTPSANNVGLESEELLALVVTDSGDVRATGTWQADAGLTLKTPSTQAAGAYAATLTLTLWEE